jgi:SRSO17 transposase
VVYAAQAGHAFIDRALYLPRSWVDDPARCRAAGVPADIGFATKPALARAMIARALDAGTPASWVAGDEVYGNDPQLCADLHERGIGYVLAVARDHQVRTGIGKRRAVDLAVRLPTEVWQRRSAGSGAKGHRLYDWALVDIDEPDTPGCHWLLIRRSLRTGELAFHRAHGPTPVPLAALVRVAGRRWTVEESFQTGKGLAGLDQHQVRRWTSWHRWTVLAMLAHVFLAVMATAERAQSPPGLIPLTRGEIRHLFTSLRPHRGHDPRHLLRWSR